MALAPVTPSPVAARLSETGPVRLGMVALSTDLTSEGDARRLLPAEAGFHVSRVAFENPTTPENLRRMAPRLGEAAALITPGVTLAALGYSCTAASVTIGDAAVAAALGQGRPGVPVVTPPGAALEGFAALGVTRIALVTPYLVETTEPMVRYFAAAGLEVVRAHCLGLADDREIARIEPAAIRDAAAAADCAAAEALFLSCTALRALPELSAIEARLGKPVLSSNQAMLWRMLHHAGLPPAPGTWGRLFERAPLERAA